MSKAVENRTVAITEHRFEKELMSLIEPHGANVISCPLLEERPVENRSELRAFISRGIVERILLASPKMAPLADAIAADFERADR